VNDRIEQQNSIIDRNMREAHQQISMRPEYVERVLGVISDEIEQQNAVARLVMEREQSRRSWRRVAVLAASLLIVMLWSVWARDHRKISKNTDRAEVGGNKGGVVRSDPVNDRPATPLNESPTHSSDQAVKAAEGFLASRLYDDEAMEIYLVLPTQKTTLQF
jgi:hypothetical protein